MACKQEFGKRERISRRDDFARVFARNCRSADAIMVVYVARNGLTRSRLGISVSRRVGNAVRRSYVRRRIREAFRTHKEELPKGFDIVCVPRPQAADRNADLVRSFCRLVLQAVNQDGGRDCGNRHPPDRDAAAK